MTVVSTCIIAVMGCTGAGKSKLAIEIAERIGGEIISTDSMQVYLGLDIVTNKVTPEERLRVPHHLLNFVAPTEEFTVVQFRELALRKIEEIRLRGHIPILCGGTSYYIDSILYQSPLEHMITDDVIDQSDNDTEETECDWEELNCVDQSTAAKLHPNDRRKIRRAMEVYRQTGMPYSTWLDKQNQQEKGCKLRYKNTLLLWVDRDPIALGPVLDRRVDDMMCQGALEEMYKVWCSLPTNH
eukprot:Ihof_evm3s579 gene=Ihof_evmTU3s579